MTSQDLTKVLAPIDDDAPHMETRLIEWANINSGSENTTGLVRMGDLIIETIRRLGAEVEKRPVGDDGRFAIRAIMRPGAPRSVLLNGHFDTVYGPGNPFQQCTRVNDDCLRGPGVADMKGGIVIMLAALRALEASGAADGLGWEIILTPDEETGSVLSAPLLKECAARHDLGIVFEAALPDGSIVSSRKGVATVKVEVRGRAAHAGRDFTVGRNAIVALSHFVAAAHDLNHRLPHVVVNAGVIAGGGTINIVPDRAVAEFNVRAARTIDGEEVLRRMEDSAAAIAHANEVEFLVSGGFNRPVMEETDASRGLAEAWCAGAKTLGLSIGRGDTGGGSDANLLSAAGLPCIDGAGVEGGELHSDREWMRLSSLARRTKVAAVFLLNLATGKISLPEHPRSP